MVALEPVAAVFDALQQNIQTHAEWSGQQGPPYSFAHIH